MEAVEQFSSCVQRAAWDSTCQLRYEPVCIRLLSNNQRENSGEAETT